MNGFYDIYIPSLKEYIPFKEINTNQQTVLTKNLIAEPGPLKTEFVRGIKKLLEQNNIDEVDINKLNIVDVLCIMIALKCVSSGEKLSLSVTCPECENTYDINIKADEIYNKLIAFKTEPHQIKINNYTLFCDVPNLKHELNIMKTIKDKECITDVKQMVLLNIKRFITKITENGKEINYDYNTFFDDIDINDFKKILKYVNSLDTKLNKINVYEVNCMNDECGKLLKRNLSLNYQSLYSLYNLLFNINLGSIYKDMYYLSKIGLPIQFVQNLTALERNVFWGIFSEEMQKRKEKNNKTI